MSVVADAVCIDFFLSFSTANSFYRSHFCDCGILSENFKIVCLRKKTKSSRFSFAHSLINPKQCYIIISFLHVSVADFNNLCRSLSLSPFFPCVGIFMDFFVTFFISILILLRTHWNHIFIVAFSRLVSSLPSNFSCSQSIWAYLNGRIFLPSIESIPIAEP